MLDLRFVVANLDHVKAALARRGAHASAALVSVEAEAHVRKELIVKSETLRAEQKKQSDAMKTLRGEAQAELRTKLKAMADEVKALDTTLREVEARIEAALLSVPNLPHPSVPDGQSEHDNVVQGPRNFGAAPTFAFAPKDHVAIGEGLGLLDFERAAKISGARFAVLKGDLARLERAVLTFFLDVARERGYTEVLTPYLVNQASLRGTGQLPKFEADLFKTTVEPPLYLIPTAEVPVTNLHRDEILGDPNSPPIGTKYACFSPCFRSEAGSAGKDTRGLIRMHQFHKVELVRFETPEDSQEALEQLTTDAQEPLKRLGLHHRVVALCAGDMGANAEKTYDLEVWLPGQSAFREISSCSSFGDYQARRAQIRFRPSATEKPKLAHTLNGSGLAVGRTVVAILENYQQADGSVVIPEALRPYLGGLEKLTKV